MSLIVHRPFFLFLIAMIALGTTSLRAAEKDEVALFAYRGIIPQHDSSGKFDTFYKILDSKIAQIRREVFKSDIVKLEYLKDIRISYYDKDTFTHLSSIDRWMRNQDSVLCLLRGTIISDDNITYMVKSEFHLGELRQYFPYDVIRIDLPINSSEFGNTRDSHSLVILYALAMDAKRSGHDNALIALFLTTASNKLADLKRRSGELSGDLIELEKAIKQASMELLRGNDDK